MNAETSILVIEDSVVTSVAVSRVLEQTSPGCRIVRAQTCFEAQLLMRIYDFALFVIDVHLPDGCGLDLVGEILTRKPTAGVIVLTADSSPELRDRSAAYGIHYFLNKPFQAVTLEQAARNCLEQGAVEGNDRSFTATLQSISVLEILQLKCLNGSSTQLEISTASPEFRVGNAYIVGGQIVHATVHDASFRVTSEGEEALFEILRWKGGEVREFATPASVERSLFESWQSLLLSAAQTADETANAAAMVAA